jgi:hypothetical protein
MRKIYLTIASAAFAFAAGVGAAGAQAPATVQELVVACETAPDYYEGNCPPSVGSYFDALMASGSSAAQIDSAVADVSIALVQRGQQAANDGDIPLCIDISQGIVTTAGYSSDPAQQESVRELAKFACCVIIEGTDYGLGSSGTTDVPLTGATNDGAAVAGVSIFQSAGATFVTDGVQPGDILVILDGAHEGMFTIVEVSDENTLMLAPTPLFTDATATAESGLTFDIRRPSGDLAANQCDPGFKTASILPEIVYASPN